ncbi:MAG: PilZ domain-containing protein [Aeromonas sp.]
MAHHPILTEDELTMLRELGCSEETHFLSGHLDNPMLGLLQKAEQLVLEARYAGHHLRFPLTFTQREDGFVEPRLAAPVIRELGFAQPRAWRLAQKATLQTAHGALQVLSLSLNGLIVENLPTDMVADATLQGTLQIEAEPPFPLQAKLVRRVNSHTDRATWALSFQMSEANIERLRRWLFLRHQDTFNDAYQPA